MEKKCTTCKESRNVKSFYEKGDGHLYSQCSDCMRELKRKRYKENPEKFRAKTNEDRKNNPWRYAFRNVKLTGITNMEIWRLREKHSGFCEICKKKNNGRHLCVDHNHTTNTFRGFLCGKCNRGIGYFNDDIQLLKKAIIYLTK